MNVMPSFRSIAAPARDELDYRYDADCKAALAPYLTELLGRAETAGWNRRRAAAALMFLAAQQVTATGSTPG